MKPANYLMVAVISIFWAIQAKGDPLPDKVTLVSLVDVTGKEHAIEKGKPVVLAWTASDCPMAKVYAPRLRKLAAEMMPKGVQFFLIDSSPDATPEKLRQASKGAVPVICDEHGALAQEVGARSTTDAVLLDGDLKVVYRGAVDDQYGFRRQAGLGAGTYRKDTPTQQFLHDAVEAVLAGKQVTVGSTDPMGCLLEWAPSPDVAKDAPVFYGDVEKIFSAHCNDCHQNGGYAPFSLVKYEEARRHGRMIAEVVDDKRMPPWNANPKYGHFANDPTLTADQIMKIKQWVDAGTPSGDVAKALPPLPPRPEWDIGKPDVIYETEPAEIAAEGQMPYRYVRIPTNFKEDHWVEATQILSTSSQVVHHVLILIDSSGPAPAGVVRPWTPPYTSLIGGGGGGLDGSFATTLAAGRGMIYPPGRAKLLPAGATIVMQIHYTPDGTPHQSKTRLGMRFAKQPPTEPVDSRALATVAFMIPPGDPSYEVISTRVMPRDATLLSLRPHMHLRGKSFRYVAEFPDGKKEVLLDVPKWDFEWQVEYVLAKPRLLPQGTLLRAIATYDNSQDNPANPDPSKRVFFGLQSTDEMMIGYYEVVWH
jgi:hypothetical protein